MDLLHEVNAVGGGWSLFHRLEKRYLRTTKAYTQMPALGQSVAASRRRTIDKGSLQSWPRLRLGLLDDGSVGDKQAAKELGNLLCVHDDEGKATFLRR